MANPICQNTTVPSEYAVVGFVCLHLSDCHVYCALADSRIRTCMVAQAGSGPCKREKIRFLNVVEKAKRSETMCLRTIFARSEGNVSNCFVLFAIVSGSELPHLEQSPEHLLHSHISPVCVEMSQANHLQHSGCVEGSCQVRGQLERIPQDTQDDTLARDLLVENGLSLSMVVLHASVAGLESLGKMAPRRGAKMVVPMRGLGATIERGDRAEISGFETTCQTRMGSLG